MRNLIAAIFLLASTAAASAQSGCPTFATGLVLTAAQWTACFAAKQNVIGYVPVNKAGDVMLGRLVTSPSAVGGAGLNVPPGTAPTSPVNGDLWTTTAGLFARINGSTVGPYVSAGGFSITVGTTTISGGSSGNVIRNNAGVVGEYAVSGTGSVCMTTSCSMTTPSLGAATATSINKVAVTQPATGATLTIPDGVTLNAGPGGTLGTAAFQNTGTSGANVPLLNGANTWASTQVMTHLTVEGVTSSGATGTGSFVFATNASLVTPNINVATATSINKVAITAPASSATLTIADGKTLTANNTMTIAGTDGTTLTGPSTSATLAALNIASQVLTGGVNVTALALSTGNVTVDCGQRPLQTVTNNGAWIITAPASDGSCVILVTNGASAQVPTYSGFSVGANTGDTVTTTNGNKFYFIVYRVGGVSTYSWKAAQ